MADGSFRPISSLMKGDRVAVASVRGSSSPMEMDESNAEVACLVAFRIPAGRKNMVQVPDSSLVITPTHYILSSNARSHTGRGGKPIWIHPSTLSSPTAYACTHVYHVLLSPTPDPEVLALNVGGIWVSTMGRDPNHLFSGNYTAVVRELKCIDKRGLEAGYIELSGLKRGKDGYVCGYIG